MRICASPYPHLHPHPTHTPYRVLSVCSGRARGQFLHSFFHFFFNFSPILMSDAARSFDLCVSLSDVFPVCVCLPLWRAIRILENARTVQLPSRITPPKIGNLFYLLKLTLYDALLFRPILNLAR